MPIHQTHANLAETTVHAFFDITIGLMLSLIKSILVGLIGLMGSGIDSILSISIGSSGVVQNTWNLVRGFANMAFILVLIVMAFGTIFNVQGYDLRSLIAKFLIAALLINFSLTIGVIIIDWTQSLSNVFLQAIGSVGNRLAQEARLASRFSSGPLDSYGVPVDLHVFQSMLAAFADVILLAIIFFSLAVLFVTILVRVPFLWALLIVSPIAWITYILPSTRNINRMWWKYFIGWNVFLPIYLFSIYFAVLLLSKRQDLLSGTNTVKLMGVKFEDIFFYVLIAIFLIGGAKMAMKAGMSAGAGGVALGIWGKGAARAKLAGGIPWRASGAAGVYKEAKKTFQEKGFAGFEATEKNLGRFYQGQQGRDKAAAWLGQKTGLAPGLADKQFQSDIKSFEEKYEKQFKDNKIDESRLKGIAGNTNLSLQERVAAANKLKDLGDNIEGGDMSALYDAYSQRSPADAVRWIRGQNIDNLNPKDLDALDKAAKDKQLKQKIARVKAKRNLLSPEEYTQKFVHFEGKEGELASFIGDTDKDFIDGLKKQEALRILEALKGKGEAEKKFALKIAEKGFFAGTYEDKDEVQKNAEALLTGLVGTGKEGDASEGAHGAFGSATEAGKFLDLVKKANLAEALQIKQSKDILTDMYEKGSDGKNVKLNGAPGLQKAMQQELSKASNEELGKMIRVEVAGKDANGNNLYKAKDQMVLAAFKQSLKENPRAAQKIKNMYVDPKFTGNTPLVGALDQAMNEVLAESFETDKGQPFNKKVGEVTGADGLISKVEKAMEDNGIEDAKIHYKKALKNLEEASKLIKGIDRMDFIAKSRKEELERILSDAQDKLEKAKKKKPKNPGPDDTDETPPDDKEPKGGGGGGGSSGGSGGTPPPGGSSGGGKSRLSPFGGSRASTSTWPSPRPQTPPPAESESRVGNAGAPFSTKAGTIPSGEIGRPAEPEIKPTPTQPTYQPRIVGRGGEPLKSEEWAEGQRLAQEIDQVYKDRFTIMDDFWSEEHKKGASTSYGYLSSKRPDLNITRDEYDAWQTRDALKEDPSQQNTLNFWQEHGRNVNGYIRYVDKAKKFISDKK